MAISEDDETMRWRAELEDGLTAEVRSMTDSLDDLGDESIEANLKLKALERQAKKTGNELALAAAKAKVASLAIDDHGEKVRRTALYYRHLVEEQDKTLRGFAKVDHAVESLNDQTRKFGMSLRRNRYALGEIRRGFSGFLPVITKLAGITFKVGMGMFFMAAGMGAVALIAGGIKLVPALASVVVQLTSLLSFAFLLPTALSVLILTVITLTMAMRGLGAAVGAAFQGDWAAFEESLTKLSPQAQKFVRNLVKFVPALKNIKATVQDEFFKPLADDITGFMDDVLPVFGKGASTLAGSLSKIVRAVMLWFQSSRGLAFLTRMFDAGSQFADKFAAHIGPVLNGLERVTLAIQPIWARLMVGMGTSMDKFGAWLTRISDDGTLETWLNTAIDTTKLLGAIFGDLFRVIRAIAGVSDGGSLGRFTVWLDALADFLESSDGQQMMLTFFKALTDVTTAMKPTQPILAEILATLATAIAAIVVAAAPGLIEFLTAFSEALTQMTVENPGLWIEFGESIGLFFTDMLKVLPAVMFLFKKLIEILSWDHMLSFILLLVVIATLVTNLVTFILPIIGAMASAGLMASAVIFAIVETIAVIVMLIATLVIFWDEIVWGFKKAGEFVLNYWEFLWWTLQWIASNVLEPFNSLLYDIFVQPFVTLYEWIMKGIDALTDLYSKLRDGFFQGSFNPGDWDWGALNPFRFAGGPVEGGQAYTVNELGPEKFLSDSGQLSNIGDGSMSTWTAPSAGVVIPAHLTDAFDRAIAAASTVGSDGAAADTNLERVLAGQRGGDTYIDNSTTKVDVTVTNPGSDVDVERAVVKAMKKAKKEEAERK